MDYMTHVTPSVKPSCAVMRATRDSGGLLSHGMQKYKNEPEAKGVSRPGTHPAPPCATHCSCEPLTNRMSLRGPGPRGDSNLNWNLPLSNALRHTRAGGAWERTDIR